MKDKHPIFYLLIAAAVAGSLLTLLIVATASWRSAGFWQACSVLLLILITALSIDLFRQVSRFYPLIRGGRATLPVVRIFSPIKQIKS